MKMLSACLLLLPFISCTQVQDTKNDAVIEQKIETLLSSMTLEEKIGQMFFVRYPDDETAPKDASQYSLGGYILFAKDFKDKTSEGWRSFTWWRCQGINSIYD